MQSGVRKPFKTLCFGLRFVQVDKMPVLLFYYKLQNSYKQTEVSYCHINIVATS